MTMSRYENVSEITHKDSKLCWPSTKHSLEMYGCVGKGLLTLYITQIHFKQNLTRFH